MRDRDGKRSCHEEARLRRSAISSKEETDIRGEIGASPPAPRNPSVCHCRFTGQRKVFPFSRRCRVSTNVPKKVTVPWLREAPARGERLVELTAYDYPQARAADAAGVDIVLVGDSLAMVVLGHADTLSVTMEEMLHHVKAVRRGLSRALLIADMPYGSFHLGPEQAVANALRFIKEGGASAVKIEG